jgi:hypothetical protein
MKKLNPEELFLSKFLRPCSCSFKTPDFTMSMAFTFKDKVMYFVGRFFCPICKKEYLKN